MAVHRSPGARPARRRAAPRHASRANALAGAAALGAVTTGSFTALIPVVDAAPTVPDVPIEAALASVSVPLKVTDGASSRFLPVRAVAIEDQRDDPELAKLGKAFAIAADIAAMHEKQQREQAEQAEVDRMIAKGGLDGWIAEALRVMDLPQSLAPSIKKVILKESNGNPNAINRWDANAQRGTPSQGLMQTIPVTFRKFVHPSLANRSIIDPVANITAGVRYMIATYGMGTLQQGGRRTASGAYQGY